MAEGEVGRARGPRQNQMKAPLAGDAAAAGAKKKVSVLSFMFHEHSLLGLFAPDDHVPPPITPCCCLCVFTDALTRRMRLFVFLVVFALTTTMAVEVQLGIHGSFYQFCFTVLCVTPITCHLKSNLPRYSGWLRDRGVGPFGPVRAEEVLLVGAILYAVIRLVGSLGEDGAQVLGKVLSAWAGTLTAELTCKTLPESLPPSLVAAG